MRRTIATAITVLALAACSPYDTPADAAPAPTTTTTTAACDRACWERIIARQHAERLYWAEVVKRQKREAEARRIARIYAFAHAVEQARLARLAYPSGQCGGSLPPCYVMRRESGGNIRAQNPRSTASGKWQFLDSTWRRIPAASGYAKARHAPEHVQDAAARWLWNGGRGCSHWSAC